MGHLHQLKGLGLVVREMAEQTAIGGRPLVNARHCVCGGGETGHQRRTEQHGPQGSTEDECATEQQTEAPALASLRRTRATGHGDVVPADATLSGAAGGDSSNHSDVAVL